MSEVRVTSENLTEIYSRYVDMVYRVCLVLLKNVPDAEDAVQTVFVKLLSAGGRFTDGEHLKAWLIVTARNVCRDLLKSAWRTRRAELDEDLEAAVPSESGVWSEVAALPEKYRLPVYLHYYEGYKTREIAGLLHLNHATLRLRLHTARKLLRLTLEEENNDG